MAFCLELRSTITLPNDESTHDFRRFRDASLPFAGFERLSDLHICFARKRVNRRVGKQISEIDGIALADVTSFLCFWDVATRVVVLLPLLPEHEVLGERSVDARQTHRSSVLLPQPEANLLAAPAVLSANLQDELRGDGVEIPALPVAFALPLSSLELS